jgi:flagellar hook-length control protein FliK
VSQVASDAQVFAINRPLPPTRPAVVSDQAATTPFARLLDDSMQGPPNNPPPPATDNRPTRADQARQADGGDDTQATSAADNAKSADAKPANATSSDAKSADTNPADTKSTDAKSGDTKSADAKSADINSAIAKPADVKPANAKPVDPSVPDQSAEVTAADLTLGGLIAKSGKTASDSKGISDGKAASDGKTKEEAVADDSKPASDAKPTDGQVPVVAIAAAAPPAAAPIQVLTPTDAPALAPESDVIAASPAATLAMTNPAIDAMSKLETSAPATLQNNTGKPGAAPKSPEQTASPPQTDDKSHATASDADKTAVAQARGEPSGKDHHATTAETPVAPTADTNTADTNAAAPKAIADAMQTSALNAPAQTTPATAAPSLTGAPQLVPQAAAIPLTGVAIDIASNAAEGKNHFEIRLDPPELGRIEVRLDVDKDGNVTSHLIADRSDTLDLLRRDSASLERTLQDAGLKTADNGLQFSLRDHSSQPQQDNSPTHTARLVMEDNTPLPFDAAQRGYSRLAGQGSGIDIHV